MEDYGFRISKTGVDAGTAIFKDVIMTSAVPVFKINLSGTGALTKGTGVTQTIGTIAHNLGYIPTCYATGTYMKTDETGMSTKYSYWNRNYPWGANMYDTHKYYADTANLYIRYNTSYYSASALTFNYAYHIFYDEEV